MIYLGSDAVIVNQFGQVLLCKRDDSRTWALPGGGVTATESAPEAVVREVEEETGLKTMAVRLVGLYHRAESGADRVTFSFRCIPRGGELQTSAEATQVGYFHADRLPSPMLALHRQRTLEGIHHAAGVPTWRSERLPASVHLLRNALYGWRDARRRWRGESAFPQPAGWRAGAFVVIRNDQGGVLWAQRADDGRWNLPGGGVQPGETPWDAAVRETREETGLAVRLTSLSGVYAKPDVAEVVFSFTGVTTGGSLTTGAEAVAFQYRPPDKPPDNALVNHVSRVADGIDPVATPYFRKQQSHQS